MAIQKICSATPVCVAVASAHVFHDQSRGVVVPDPVEVQKRPMKLDDLPRFVAGTDVFSRQSDGIMIADR
jgi:hypothetical protein